MESKLPGVGTTIFTVMSQLAQQHGAINLSQGFPDFPCDPLLLQAVSQAMQDGYNQYAPMPGLPRLRDILAHKLEAAYGQSYDPEQQITITAGATQALYTAITALIQPGDEVLLFEPAYDSYGPAIRLNGGIEQRISLRPPQYAIDWAEVQRRINPRTRLIILNNPNNPSTAILGPHDLRELRELLQQWPQLYLLSDEVYEHIVFDGAQHQSLARDPVLAARSMLVYSFGKTFHATGWKIGYCAGPADWMQEFRRVHQFLVFSVNTPMQHALAAYLQTPAHYQALPGFYQAKRDRFVTAMAASRFELLPSQGTYFQLARYDRISDLPDTAFAQWLTKEHGVAVIPLSAFHADGTDHGIIRFCFAKQDATLDAAATRLCQV